MASVTPTAKLRPGGPGGSSDSATLSTFFNPGWRIPSALMGIATERRPAGAERQCTDRLSISWEPESQQMKRAAALAVAVARSRIASRLVGASLSAASYNVYVCGGWSPTAAPFVQPAFAGHTSSRRTTAAAAATRTEPFWATGQARYSERTRRELDRHRAARPQHHSHLHGQRYSAGVGDGRRLVGRVLLERWSRASRPERPAHRRVRHVRLLSGLVQRPHGRLVRQLRLVVTAATAVGPQRRRSSSRRNRGTGPVDRVAVRPLAGKGLRPRRLDGPVRG